MTEQKRRPITTLQFWSKEEKKAYTVAACWNNDRFSWKMDVSPEKRPDPNHERFPSMLLSEAARRAEAGEGYLSLAKPKSETGEYQGDRRDKRQIDDDEPLPF